MLVDPLTIQVVSAIAYFVLAAGGVVLWTRHRSPASALVGIGFTLMLLREIAVLSDYLRFKALIRGSTGAGDAFFLIHHHAAVQGFSLLGLCAAATGLLWYALGVNARSPNPRLERP